MGRSRYLRRAGTAGDEAEFVALSDGRVLVDAGPDGFDPEPLAAALEGAIERPYRALAMRRPEMWAVGASVIETARLDPDPRGDDLELTWDGSTLALVADGCLRIRPTQLLSSGSLPRASAARTQLTLDGSTATSGRFSSCRFRCLIGNSRGPDDGHDAAPDRHPRASHRLQACTTRE